MFHILKIVIKPSNVWHEWTMDPVFLGCSGKDYLTKNINDAFLMVDILMEIMLYI